MPQCPPPLETDLDARGSHLLPGFIDAHCHLGMLADGLSYDDDDCNEISDPCTPNLRAIDGLYPMDYCFQEARRPGSPPCSPAPAAATPSPVRRRR